MVSERMGGAEHTKLDDEFTKLEQQTDTYIEMQVNILSTYSILERYTVSPVLPYIACI